METTRSTDRVLLADDDKDTLDSLCELLRLVDPQLRVSVADGGAAALAFATRTAFDTVVLDIEMPGMDGISAAHAIRSAGRPRAPLLIALSSRIDGRDPARMAIFDHVLRKPVDIDQLCSLIRSGRRRSVGDPVMA